MQHGHGIAAPPSGWRHGPHHINKAPRNLRADVAIASFGAGCNGGGLELNQCVHRLLLNHTNKTCATGLCITYSHGMEQPKSPGGRPPKPEAERRVQRSIRLLPRHWAKIDAAGKEAFEAYIERWRPPPAR